MCAWISNDFPRLTETERQEYEQLKKAAPWLCICCSKPVRHNIVQFDSNIKVHYIDNGPYAVEEYKGARENALLKAKMTFKVDILRAEKMLAPFLCFENRQKVRLKLSI